MLDNLKMDLNMEKVSKLMPMEIFIKDNLSMDFRKEVGFIYGKMDPNIMEISSKATEMGMEYGKISIKIKHIKVITC